MTLETAVEHAVFQSGTQEIRKNASKSLISGFPDKSKQTCSFFTRWVRKSAISVAKKIPFRVVRVFRGSKCNYGWLRVSHLKIRCAYFLSSRFINACSTAFSRMTDREIGPAPLFDSELHCCPALGGCIPKTSSLVGTKFVKVQR